MADSLLRRIRQRGVAAEIIRDGDHLSKVICALSPEFILGVCCPEEIEQLRPMLDAGAFRYRAVFVEESQAGKMGSCSTYIDEDRCLVTLDEVIASECGSGFAPD
ncbi:MAG: hypothetical protein N3D11_05815 [Candidatus Sumerlaeia bacterium]|nr:hypothetical protein [Candidatus Sumerlaeia bacterium]